MNKTWCIYCHRNKFNNKCYIGMTSNYQKRCTPSHYKGSTYFFRAIQKYGWNGFEHFILFDGITNVQQADYYQQMFIRLFDTANREFGYNLTFGGSNGRILTDQAKQRIKQNHANFKGVNHPLYGKHLSEQTKDKLRNSHIGHKQSDQQKKRHSDYMKSANNPKRRAVICITTGQVFIGAKEAAIWCNQHDGSLIGKCCKGKRKHSGKHPLTNEPLQWAYYDNKQQRQNNDS